MTDDTAAKPALELRGIVKYFPSTATLALDQAEFLLGRGEIHALVGDNGAGKSTLARIIAGFDEPDSGVVLVDGMPRVRHGVRAAERSGIAMVQQHEVLAPELDVAVNVTLGFEPARLGIFFDRRAAEREVERLSALMGVRLDPRARVRTLGPAERRFVELARALARGSSVLILDEPTNLLSEREAARFYDCVRSIKAGGASVILVSHRAREVRDVADRVTTLKNGRNHGTRDMAGDACADPGNADATAPSRPAATSTPDGTRAVLRFERVSCSRSDGSRGLDDVSFDVKPGEIVAVCAHAGNGLEVLEAVASGERAPDEGRAFFDGMVNPGRRALRSSLVSYIPTERERFGLSVTQTVEENVAARPSAAVGAASSRPGAARRRRAIAALDRFGFGFKPERAVRELSGGNRQRVVVARELAEPGLAIVAANPTQGLDRRARADVRSALAAAAASGRGVLVLASNAEEVAGFADRAFALYRGRLREASGSARLEALMTGIEP